MSTLIDRTSIGLYYESKDEHLKRNLISSIGQLSIVYMQSFSLLMT